MDPWLENPDVWRGLHALLIGYTVEQLQPQLLPRGYYADIEERVWLEEGGVYPDVTVSRYSAMSQSAAATVAIAQPVFIHRLEEELREGFVQIRERAGHRLITSIEILSPVNNSHSKGRRLFMKKQRELRVGGINLVEIDLLRQGRHALTAPQRSLDALKPWDYVVGVWRPNKTDHEVYPVALRERLPGIGIPLKADEVDAALDLQAALDRAYDVGPYRVKLDYARPPAVPLSEEDAAWADQLLRQTGLRKSAS
jgi:hypothetical protein